MLAQPITERNAQQFQIFCNLVFSCTADRVHHQNLLDFLSVFPLQIFVN